MSTFLAHQNPHVCMDSSSLLCSGEIIPKQRAGTIVELILGTHFFSGIPVLCYLFSNPENCCLIYFVRFYVCFFLMEAGILHTSDCIIFWSGTPLIGKWLEIMNYLLLLFFLKFLCHLVILIGNSLCSVASITLFCWFHFPCSYYFFPIKILRETPIFFLSIVQKI